MVTPIGSGYSQVLDENLSFLEEERGPEKGAISVFHQGTSVSEIPSGSACLSDFLLSCTLRNQHLLPSSSAAHSVT